MITLVNAVQAWITAALAGVEYDNPAAAPAGKKAVAVHLAALPAKRTTPEQEQDFPFVVIRPGLGEGTRSETRALLRLVGGVWTSGDSAAGALQALDLLERLLAVQRGRRFSPWKLELPVKWRWGDGEEFAQAHPFYLVIIDLQFKGPPLADIKA